MDRKILIDTNIAVELLLSQQNAEIVADIFDANLALYITDFSLNSIFVISRRKKASLDDLKNFLKILLKRCRVIVLNRNELTSIYKTAINNNLDFDDAQILYTAKKNKLKILTFDKDLLRLGNVAINAKSWQVLK